MWFIGIDALGAFFSLMSLVAQNEFDVLGGVQYIVCLVLEIGLFVLWGWDLGRRAWRRKKGLPEVTKEVGKSDSDSDAEVEAVSQMEKKSESGKGDVKEAAAGNDNNV
jgi:hypothetical protein